MPAQEPVWLDEQGNPKPRVTPPVVAPPGRGRGAGPGAAAAPHAKGPVWLDDSGKPLATQKKAPVWLDDHGAPTGENSGFAGMAKQVWDVVNSPVFPSIATKAHAAANWLNEGAVTPGVISTAKGFLAGALGATGDVAASFTSPASLFMLASGTAEARAAKQGLTAVASLLRSLRVGGSALFAAQGAQQTVQGLHEGDVEKTLMGIGTAAGGAAGVGHGPLGGAVEPRAAAPGMDVIPKPQNTGLGQAGRPVVVPGAMPVASQRGTSERGTLPLEQRPPGEDVPVETPRQKASRLGLPLELRPKGEEVPVETPPAKRTLPLEKRAPGEEAPGPLEGRSERVGNRLVAKQKVETDPRTLAEIKASVSGEPTAKPKRIAKPKTPAVMSEDVGQALLEGTAKPTQVPPFERLTYHEQNELRRIQASLNSGNVTERQFIDLTNPADPDLDRPGGTIRNDSGAYIDEVKGGSGGDRVFHDIMQGKGGGKHMRLDYHLSRYIDGEAKPDATVQRAIALARSRAGTGPIVEGDSGASLPPDAGYRPVMEDPVPYLGQDTVRHALENAGMHSSLVHSIVDGNEMRRVIDLARQMHADGGSYDDIEASFDRFAQMKIADEQAREAAYTEPDLMASTHPADRLATGEEQPRLPGEAGAVRDTEVAHPQFELPPEENFLKAENGRPDEHQKELFGGFGAVGIPKELTALVKSIGKEWGGRLASGTVTETAKKAAGYLRNTFADIANEEDRRQVLGAATYKGFSRQSDAANIAAISQYERDGTWPANVDPEYAQIYQDSMNQAHRWLQQAFGDDAVGFIDNYVRRAFKFASKDDEDASTSVLLEKMRKSLSANKSVTRTRALKMPLEEALATLRARGIDVQPQEVNPERLRQWSLNNAYRALRYKELGDWLVKDNLIRLVKTGTDPRHGDVPLSDRRFQIYFRTDKGLVKQGTYYADPSVARILDRAISPGLSRSPTYRLLRSTENTVNQLNLGFSAFHATETAINSGISDLARGISAIGRGDVAQASRSIGRSLVPFASVGSHLFKGRAFVEGVKNGDPALLETMRSVFNPAGGRLVMERRYNTSYLDNFKRAMANQEHFKALANFLPAIPQILAKPLMEYAIPRIKVGAFLDLSRDIQKRLGAAPYEQRVRAYQLAWDSIDNRFGMLTHDNLHWDRTASDVTQLAFRSVGWNLGTVRELGGGTLDLRKIKSQGMTDRLAYTIALPIYAGLLGAAYQMFHTGTWPQDLKSYYFPKNGLKDASGNDDRSLLKTYMSDVIAAGSNFPTGLTTTIGHKVSPLLELAAALWQNQNYAGDLVWNPQDDLGPKLEQGAKFALEAATPFSVTALPPSWRRFLGQTVPESQENLPLEQSVERGFGFQKAPTRYIQGDLQQKAQEDLRNRIGTRHRTPEQVQTDDLKSQARAELKTGKTDALKKLVAQGVFPTQKSLRAFLQGAGRTPFQRVWLSLPKADRAKLLAAEAGGS